MSGKVSTVLGFDYGELRVGVAIGQTLTGSARPLVTLYNRDRHCINWDAITKLITEWQPDALIVGMPTNDDGEPYPVAEAIKRFGNRLYGRFGLPVHYADERLSSDEAERRLGKSSKQPIDAMAATVILETWLMTHSQS
ncbi:MAG TPA: Holliday junction resolvase RuvX [Halothiobacillus sp.]|nr:Holliday junction resolvase RuvX [Halothiobacillus sp.]